MGLWTRTTLLFLLALLSLTLGLGLTEVFKNEPSDIDHFVATRNLRRAIAYRVVDYQGGKVAKSSSGDRFDDTAEALPEKHPGAEIPVKFSLIALEAHETNLAIEELTKANNELRNGSDDKPGIEELKKRIAEWNHQRREKTNKFGLIENVVRVFAMEVDSYSYTIENLAQQAFNLAHETREAELSNGALRKEIEKVRLAGGRLKRDLIDLEDHNYDTNKKLAKTIKTLALYDTYEPDLRALSNRIGNPWLRGVVVRSHEDSRVGVVWISIGKQEGVQVGQVFSIHRQGNFIGRIQIESIERNRAVGRLLEEFRGIAQIYPHDRVRATAAQFQELSPHSES